MKNFVKNDYFYANHLTFQGHLVSKVNTFTTKKDKEFITFSLVQRLPNKSLNYQNFIAFDSKIIDRIKSLFEEGKEVLINATLGSYKDSSNKAKQSLQVKEITIV